MDELRPEAIGWYGKLPTRGDFVGRGLPRAWLRTWDTWLQHALASAAQRLGAPELRTGLLAMPPWQWIVFPQQRASAVWCGVVAPSTDRVGRVFPLLLAEAYDETALDQAGLVQLQARALCLADWLDRVGALSSPKDFELGVAQWAAAAWRGTPTPAGRAAGTVAGMRKAWPAARSFWWCPEPVGDMPPPLAESWPPRESLLLDWLGLRPADARQGHA